MLNNIKLNLAGSVFIFLLLFIILFAISIFVYRKTNPPVSTGLRRFLTVLRVIALFIVILILFEPLLSLSWNRIQKPIIAVLIDTSASMGLIDGKVARPQATKRVLNQSLFKENHNDYSFEFFQFADRLNEINPAEIDTIRFNHDGTDITNALYELKEKMGEKYLAAAILLSDGNYNIGENPVRYAQDYQIPIFAIAIGDPTEQKDVVISKIVTNQITYANNNVPVDVTIKATGYKGKKAPVHLKEGAIILDSKIIELTDDDMETKVRLYYTPQTPGNQKYNVQVPLLENELTSLNNSKTFYVKVLKSKIKILVIAGGPSFDFMFTKRTLDTDSNIETTYWVLKNNQQFYEGSFPTAQEQLKNYDCVVLLDFPKRDSPQHVINALKSLFANQNKPLLLIAGKNLSLNDLKPLQNYLPFDLQSLTASEQLVTFTLSPQGLNHPLMRLSDNDIENQAKWRDLPPVYYSFRDIKLILGSINLLTVDKDQSKIYSTSKELPIIAARKINQQKSISILGYGIWRWDFLMKGIFKNSEIFSQFLGNCIRWLITREDSKLVRIVPNKDIYRSGEKISFTAETYYEDYRPLSDAQINVITKSKSKQYEVTFSSVGDGKYEGELQLLEGGDYTYSGQAFYQDRLLGEDSGRFSVEDFSMEFVDTKMNEALLQQITYKSGGKYFTPENSSDLEKEINFPERKIREFREWDIWNNLGLLIAVIGLLSVEWFIRKRKGML